MDILSNREANRLLKIKYENLNIKSCELRFEGCENWALAFAHKEKRRHYRSIDDLASIFETLLACQYCHTILDDRSKTSKEDSDRIFYDKRKWLFKTFRDTTDDI